MSAAQKKLSAAVTRTHSHYLKMVRSFPMIATHKAVVRHEARRKAARTRYESAVIALYRAGVR